MSNEKWYWDLPLAPVTRTIERDYLYLLYAWANRVEHMINGYTLQVTEEVGVGDAWIRHNSIKTGLSLGGISVQFT